jgi:hypothetical protein
MTFNSRRTNTDDFDTPVWITELLVDYLIGKERDYQIWECANGNSAISSILSDNGYHAIKTDIKTGQDFLTYKPNFDFNLIITNPPFSIKDLFITRTLHYCSFPRNKKACLLLPLTALEGKARGKLFDNQDLSIIIPNRRAQFTKAGRVAFTSAWFCFNFGLREQLYFVDADKYINKDKNV